MKWAISNSAKAIVGLRPVVFRPTYALANVGHPSSSLDFVTSEGDGLLGAQYLYWVDCGGSRRLDSRGDHGRGQDDGSGADESQATRQLRIGYVPADDASEDEAERQAGGDSDTGNHQAFAQNVGEDGARLCAESHAYPKLAGSGTHGKGEHTGHAHYGNQEGHTGKSAEHNHIQTVGG